MSKQKQLEGASQHIGDLNDELNDLYQQLEQAEETIYLLKKCVDDYCPQIKMTYSVRQYFYYILQSLGYEYPDYIDPIKDMYLFERWKEAVLEIRKEVFADV